MNGKQQSGRNRRAKSRQRRAKAVSGLTTGITLFPAKMQGTMSYATAFTFPSVAASSMQITVLRGNSVYDPDFTGIGTAVAAYTQASALYGRYRVVRLSADLTYIPITNPCTVFAVACCDSTLGTDYGRAMAQRYVWSRTIVPGGTPTFHKLSFPIHVIAGVSPSVVKNEDSWAAIVGTNPSNQVYLHIGVYNPNFNVATVNVTVRLVYQVEWSLPIEMPQ